MKIKQIRVNGISYNVVNLNELFKDQQICDKYKATESGIVFRVNKDGSFRELKTYKSRSGNIIVRVANKFGEQISFTSPIQGFKFDTANLDELAAQTPKYQRKVIKPLFVVFEGFPQGGFNINGLGEIYDQFGLIEPVSSEDNNLKYVIPMTTTQNAELVVPHDFSIKNTYQAHLTTNPQTTKEPEMISPEANQVEMVEHPIEFVLNPVIEVEKTFLDRVKSVFVKPAPRALKLDVQYTVNGVDVLQKRYTTTLTKHVLTLESAIDALTAPLTMMAPSGEETKAVMTITPSEV